MACENSLEGKPLDMENEIPGQCESPQRIGATDIASGEGKE
jgi:hypothetical protein